MEIIDNKAISLRTRYPARITETIEQSAHLGDGHVLVKWTMENAQALVKLGFKSTPSPIIKDYDYPGFYKPFDHQRTMAEFTTLNRKCFNFGDMGLGKSSATIWAADYLMTKGLIKRALVIAPLSILKSAWESDIFQTAIHRTVGIAHGTREQRLKVIRGNCDFVVINHDGIKTVTRELAAEKFDLIVVDEATCMKDVGSDRWKALKTLVLEETYLWMLTGTPAANNPVDAYGIAKLVNPDGVPRFANSWKDLTMYKVSMFTWVPKLGSKELVHKAMQPAIRFDKKDCLDLPPIVYQTREIQMSPGQASYYKKMKAELLMDAAGEQITAVNAGVLLGKLLQISAGCVYSDDGNVVDFKATTRLNEMLEVINDCPNKVLVFATFKHSFVAISEFLDKHHIKHGIINGSVGKDERSRLIKAFQHEDEMKVLLLQPRAAAHGLTLTRASTTIWFTPVPSLELWNQANARMDRPGQVNSMTVVKLVGSPVEQKLYKVLETRGADQRDLLELYREELKNS